MKSIPKELIAKFSRSNQDTYLNSRMHAVNEKFKKDKSQIIWKYSSQQPIQGHSLILNLLDLNHEYLLTYGNLIIESMSISIEKNRIIDRDLEYKLLKNLNRSVGNVHLRLQQELSISKKQYDLGPTEQSIVMKESRKWSNTLMILQNQLKEKIILYNENSEAKKVLESIQKTKQKTVSNIDIRRSINKKEINILLASPGDVDKERELLLNSLESKFRRLGYESRCGYRIIVNCWEELPTQTGYGQDIIKKQILPYNDIILAVFKHKLGTETIDVLSGSKRHKSGTVEELLYAIRNKEIEKPPLGMVYFYSEAPTLSLDPPNITRAQLNWKDLQEFKSEIMYEILYKNYKSEQDLMSKVCEDLVKNIETHFILD